MLVTKCEVPKIPQLLLLKGKYFHCAVSIFLIPGTPLGWEHTKALRSFDTPGSTC